MLTRRQLRHMSVRTFRGGCHRERARGGLCAGQAGSGRLLGSFDGLLAQGSELVCVRRGASAVPEGAFRCIGIGGSRSSSALRTIGVLFASFIPGLLRPVHRSAPWRGTFAALDRQRLVASSVRPLPEGSLRLPASVLHPVFRPSPSPTDLHLTDWLPVPQTAPALESCSHSRAPPWWDPPAEPEPGADRTRSARRQSVRGARSQRHPAPLGGRERASGADEICLLPPGRRTRRVAP